MWVGKCNKCGKCCATDMTWMRPTEEAIEWARCRGYIIRQKNKLCMQVIHPNNKCKNLTKDKLCKLHDCGKPDACKKFPINFTPDTCYGLDITKICPEKCGYKWIEKNECL